jgi:putative transposase
MNWQKGGYMKPLDFSGDNLPNQWRYVNTNLKRMGIWQDIEVKIRDTLKFSIQTVFEEEFAMQIGAGLYQRNNTRRDRRSGYYPRTITTTYGTVTVMVPKARNLRPEYKFIEKYKRRHEHFDRMILVGMLLGMTMRKQDKFFRAFLGDSVSHTTASTILNKIESALSGYRTAKIEDEYEYIYLDAIWIKIKELDIENRPVLFALGKKKNGRKKVLGFKLAQGESEEDWLSLLNDLYRRGLTGENAKLVISDNCKGLKKAVNFVWPYLQLQLCVVHKLRNILSHIQQKKKHRRELMQDASHIFRASSKKAAIKRIRRFSEKWKSLEPKAVEALMRDIENYLVYYEFPAEVRDQIKSTNPIESMFRQMRVMTRRVGYFQSAKSLHVFVFGVLWEKDLIGEGEELITRENTARNQEAFSYA